MADLQFFHAFVNEMSKGGHNLQADTFKLALTNTAPNLTSQTVWNTTVAPPPAAAFGYPAGGATITVSVRETTAGKFKLVFEDYTFEADGGQIGPFQYAWALNSDKSNKAMGIWIAPAPITIPDGGFFTIDFNPDGVLNFGVGAIS